MLQGAEHGFFDALVEELEIFAAMFQHIANDELQEFFCKRHIVFQLVEGHLRLDHPELGQMARRFAVLRPKRRAEGVNLRESQGEDLSFQLSAYGEEGGPAEKI